MMQWLALSIIDLKDPSSIPVGGRFSLLILQYYCLEVEGHEIL